MMQSQTLNMIPYPKPKGESIMRAWTMRIIGLSNILFAAFALLFEAVALLNGGKFPTKVPPTAMDWVIFTLLLAVSNYLVVHPALYGIRLIRKDESALLPCALLFAAQTLLIYARRVRPALRAVDARDFDWLLVVRSAANSIFS